MLTITYPRPSPAISTNQANAMHWGTRRHHLTPWQHATTWHAIQARRQQPAAWRSCSNRRCEVQITIPFPQSRRRDPHNYVGTICKTIVDALVTTGLWPDDTPEYVTVPEPRLVIGTHCLITITTAATETIA